MSFGNYWSGTKDIEQRDPKPDEQATINISAIATLISLINKQQTAIEQQHAAMKEIKTMMKEVSLKVEKLLHAEAYLVEE